MKKICQLILLTLLATLIFPVDTFAAGRKVAYPGGMHRLVRVYLTDKKGTPYRLKKPEEFLSARALERRKRQHISVDSTDLPISPTYLELIRNQGVEIVCQSKWNNTVLVKTMLADDLDRLKQLPCVKNAVKVFQSPDSFTVPKRSKLDTTPYKQDSLENKEHGLAHQQIEMMNGVALHQAGFRGKGMLIAILDGGFMNVDSISVFKSVDIIGTKDFSMPRASNVYSELDHGTMVLSTMATNLPHIYIGTAPEASYLLIRTETGATESLAEEDYWAAGVEYADSMGVDIVNSSLGYFSFDDKSTNYVYSDLDGNTSLISLTASRLAGKGIILTNSAGNSGNGTWKKIGVPADARDILAVGAVSKNKVNTVFSSVGPSADGRVKPDIMACGNACSVIRGNGKIGTANGTSFASPLACGMVACLWQALPHLTASQIMDLVRRSAHQYSTPDNIFGYGIPDFWKAYVNEESKSANKKNR